MRAWSVNRREKIILAAGVATAVLIVAVKWFLIPFVRFEAGITDLIEERKAVMTAYQSVVSREPLLEAEREELLEALDQYQSFLLPTEAPPLAAAALENRLKELADSAGLKVVSVKILNHRVQDFFIEIPVRIVATGVIDSFRDFIVLLERAEVFIEIQEMNLNSPTARQTSRGGRRLQGEGQIRGTLTVGGLILGPDGTESEG